MRYHRAHAHRNSHAIAKVLDIDAVLVKVQRDTDCLALDQQYPQYGFARHLHHESKLSQLDAALHALGLRVAVSIQEYGHALPT